MMPANTIIKGISEKERIYRIIPQHRFFELFDKKENVLVRPFLWDDPCENIILRSQAENSHSKRISFAFKNNLYAQCWTLEKRSDAMWQIYSGNKDAIRIRTTVKKLIDSLCYANKDYDIDHCFIGKVTYKKDDDILKLAKNEFINNKKTEAIAETLLIKKNVFDYENEVRLIYISKDSTKSKNDLYKYPICPHTLIDQVMVDARMSKYDFNKLKEKIIMVGIDEHKIEIKHSQLYDPPKGLVYNDPAESAQFRLPI